MCYLPFHYCCYIFGLRCLPTYTSTDPVSFPRTQSPVLVIPSARPTTLHFPKGYYTPIGTRKLRSNFFHLTIYQIRHDRPLIFARASAQPKQLPESSHLRVVILIWLPTKFSSRCHFLRHLRHCIAGPWCPGHSPPAMDIHSSRHRSFQ